ncbi:MAG: sigma-70 family RNA polymerase sigma factor [Planctomycetales bacterium]
MTEDDHLMIRLQEGETSAFEEIVRKYQAPLIGFFFRNTRDRQLAEDLSQETLLKVYHVSWDYLPTGKFRGWMYRIARNLMIDNIRRRSHDALIHAETDNREDEQTFSRIVGEIVPPDAHADQREVTCLVEEFLEQLPEEQRLTFTLHHFADFRLSEVAEIMECELATAKSRLRLAREKLRDKLQTKGITSAYLED